MKIIQVQCETGKTFSDAIRDAGLEPPECIEPGRFLRFPGQDKSHSNRAGWCKLFDDNQGGVFGDYSTGLSETWHIGTPANKKQYTAMVNKAKADAEFERRQRQEQAAAEVREIWDSAQPASGDHPYLKQKGVKSYGLRAVDDVLLVPMYNADNALVSIQRITVDGQKLFHPGGQVSGAYHRIGQAGDTVVICEGYATGASIHEATGYPIGVAFNCGNLAHVARLIRDRLPAINIILGSDDDWQTPGNPGQTHACTAAVAVGGRVVAPAFSLRPDGATDFNDLHQQAGLDAVAACFKSDPHEGTEVLDKARDFIARFCVFPTEHELAAVTLWAAHAHAILKFHTTPRLTMLSPEPESGKTRVLEVLELLTPDPVLFLSPSAPTIFRTMKTTQITLMLDEIDAIWKKRGSDDDNEDLRSLLNSGYRRGATIPRCVGSNHEVVYFKVFGAVAMAGLGGHVPDTILTRSIIIRMRRRAAHECVEPFRLRLHEKPGHKIRDKLAQWVATIASAAGDDWPALPPGITDRKAECWEPLIAIADQAGGHWPKTAREACVALCKVSDDRKFSLGIRLLADLRTIFKDADAMHTQTIIDKLCHPEDNGLDSDAPWAELYGKPITTRMMASLLREYDVNPRDVKVDGVNRKGYRREPLYDAWHRYLPVPEISATCATSDAEPATATLSAVADQVAKKLLEATEGLPAESIKMRPEAQVAHVALKTGTESVEQFEL